MCVCVCGEGSECVWEGEYVCGGGGGGCVPRQLIPIICFALFHHSCEIKSGSGWEVGTRYNSLNFARGTVVEK